MKVHTKIDVDSGFISHGRWMITSHAGLDEFIEDGEPGNTLITFVPAKYHDINIGDVFVCESDEYDFNDPTLYMMKMKNSNWHLTGDVYAPLETDHNVYDDVYLVKQTSL